MIGDVNVKLNAPTALRVDRLTDVLERIANVLEAITDALEVHNAAADVEQNGPRG